MKRIVTFVGNYKKELGGLLRHAATIAGGVLIAKGSLTTDSFTMILGSTSSVLGTGWSFANKIGQKKEVKTALATDPVTGDVTRHFNDETKAWEKDAPTTS
jgi:hypothetical protein